MSDGAQSRSQAPAEVVTADERSDDGGDDGGEELTYREAWSSSAAANAAPPTAGAAALTGCTAELKQAGNDAFAAGGQTDSIKYVLKLWFVDIAPTHSGVLHWQNS